MDRTTSCCSGDSPSMMRRTAITENRQCTVTTLPSSLSSSNVDAPETAASTARSPRAGRLRDDMPANSCRLQRLPSLRFPSLWRVFFSYPVVAVLVSWMQDFFLVLVSRERERESSCTGYRERERESACVECRRSLRVQRLLFYILSQIQAYSLRRNEPYAKPTL